MHRKVVVVYGARRVGKTTLLQKFLEAEGQQASIEKSEALLVNGDDIYVWQYLEC